MLRLLGLILFATVVLSSCKKEEEVKPKAEPLGLKSTISKTLGDFQSGSDLKTGKAYSSQTCKWVVKYQAENGIRSIVVKVNGANLPGYPQRFTDAALTKQDTASYFIKPTDTDTLRFQFCVIDKFGDSGKVEYKLSVLNFKTFTNLYLFTQNVLPADTVGKGLKAPNLGCYFSTLNRKTYTNATGQAAGNLIDLGIMGVDGGEYNGILFVSNDRRFVLGGDVLPQALPFEVGGFVTWNERLYFYNIDWFNLNQTERFYSNNAQIFTTDENSYYKFRVTNRCEGIIRVKEIGNLSNPASNTKKYIKFDMRVFYF